MIGDSKFEEILSSILGSDEECKFCIYKDECHGISPFCEPWCALSNDPEDYLDFEDIKKAIERGELE